MKRAPLPGPADARRLLKLGRDDPRAAREQLGGLPTESQVALVCETPVAQRGEVLKLLPEPERVIPELPDAELCFTVKAIGLADAGWVIAHARPEQIVAAVDLDAWEHDQPSVERLDAWLEAFCDADDDALVRAAKALDLELLVLWLRARVQVSMRPDEEGWTPPEGAETIDGRFFVVSLQEHDDLADVLRLLRCLFQSDYWYYFRLLQGVLWELESETGEWAGRWRAGRLLDLGFPPREEAIEIYARLRPSEREELPPEEAAPSMGAWPLPVWMPEIPAPLGSRHLVFQAAGELDDAARRSFFYGFLALANKVAVADGLPLGDAESMPTAIEKAAALASRGLAHLGRERNLSPAEVLRRVPPNHLFRVGHSLDRSRADS